MPEFFHPEGFDLVLKTTPYYLWMWLKKETKYQSTDIKNMVADPTLSPPVIDLRESPRGHKKLMFTLSRNIQTPLPTDKHAYFLMIGKGYPDWGAPADYWNRYGPTPDDPDSEVIRIDIEKVANNCTQVIGDYNLKFPEFGKYMNQIRDQMVKEFSVVEYKNGEPKESTKGKVRGPNSATIKAIDKLFEYRQNVWVDGFADMPFWTDVCKEIGISPKTAKKYAPNLRENFRDKNYKWDWFMEDNWWEDNSS